MACLLAPRGVQVICSSQLCLLRCWDSLCSAPTETSGKPPLPAHAARCTILLAAKPVHPCVCLSFMLAEDPEGGSTGFLSPGGHERGQVLCGPDVFRGGSGQGGQCHGPEGGGSSWASKGPLPAEGHRVGCFLSGSKPRDHTQVFRIAGGFFTS